MPSAKQSSSASQTSYLFNFSDDMYLPQATADISRKVRVHSRDRYVDDEDLLMAVGMGRIWRQPAFGKQFKGPRQSALIDLGGDRK